MRMRSLNVYPHVVHVPAPLATQQTDNTSTTAVNILLAVGLHVVVRPRQFCWLVIPIWVRLYLCVEGRGVDNLGKS